MPFAEADADNNKIAISYVVDCECSVQATTGLVLTRLAGSRNAQCILYAYLYIYIYICVAICGLYI